MIPTLNTPIFWSKQNIRCFYDLKECGQARWAMYLARERPREEMRVNCQNRILVLPSKWDQCRYSLEYSCRYWSPWRCSSKREEWEFLWEQKKTIHVPIQFVDSFFPYLSNVVIGVLTQDNDLKTVRGTTERILWYSQMNSISMH